MFGLRLAIFGGMAALVAASGFVLYGISDQGTAPAPVPSAATQTSAAAPSAEASSAAAAVARQAPVARMVPQLLALHGTERRDDYYWLREKSNPEVIAHLNAENAYAEAQLAPLAPLIGELYKEMADRVGAADTSVPYFDNGYWYEKRFAEGADYPLIVRRKSTGDTREEMVLDVPALAKGHPQFNLRSWEVSPDGGLVAYAVDFSGDRMHTIFVRRIATGEELERSISDVASSFAWAADNATLFYTKNDLTTVRSYQVRRHVVGQPSEGDALVYEEKDKVFSVEILPTKSRKYIVLHVDHLQATEEWIVSTADPSSAPRLIAPREKGVKYHADHVGDSFYIRTNKSAPDYRIVNAADVSPSRVKWTEVVAEKPGIYIADFEVFDRFVVLDQVHDALGTIRIARLDRSEEKEIPLPVQVGLASIGDFQDDAINRDPRLTTVRFGFSSPVTPDRIYDYDVEAGSLSLLKEHPAIRWFNPEVYDVVRITALAVDGESVPITLLFRKDKRVTEGNPTLLYAYGSYG